MLSLPQIPPRRAYTAPKTQQQTFWFLRMAVFCVLKTKKRNKARQLLRATPCILGQGRAVSCETPNRDAQGCPTAKGRWQEAPQTPRDRREAKPPSPDQAVGLGRAWQRCLGARGHPSSHPTARWCGCGVRGRNEPYQTRHFHRHRRGCSS